MPAHKLSRLLKTGFSSQATFAPAKASVALMFAWVGSWPLHLGAIADEHCHRWCIDIVDALASARAAMSLSALSRAIQAPKSTMLTIVRTLARRGLVTVSVERRADLLAESKYRSRAQLSLGWQELRRSRVHLLGFPGMRGDWARTPASRPSRCGHIR